jgi:DNA-binding winged helix-turn-helix (wHTH) protein
MQYRFGPFVADRVRYCVSRNERLLNLTPKLLDLLFFLLEHPEALVTKEQLLDSVWRGANVTENALAQAMSELREALEDSAASPTYIRTVARRGYRFVAPVDRQDRPPADRPAIADAVADNAGAALALRRQAAGAAAPSDPSTPGIPTIAVLDFENVTGEADTSWLASGIAETVSNDLSRVSGLRVIERWHVLQARPGEPFPALAASLGASLLVRGSYQRAGQRLRVTSRVVSAATGDIVAEAKVDGSLADVFAIQDEIVASFARALGWRVQPLRPSPRETSSLEAFRAYTEGWLQVESLDTSLIGPAIAAFERAIALDPDYAMAYTGLASAQWLAYEMTRANDAPDVDALDTGLEHARRAVALDDRLADAHATLSFLLVSAREFEDARAAAQRAVAIEPDNWRHQFRLGHASWGAARLRAVDRAHVLYPQFPYATLERAMVFVARGDLDDAERAARQGSIEQDRQRRLGYRYPAAGFHWLLGAIDAARGVAEAAVRHFEHELSLTDARQLYGPEYAAAALVGRGFIELAQNATTAAAASFDRACAFVGGYPRAILGSALVVERCGGDAQAAWRRLEQACDNLRRTGRPHEASLISASRAAARGDTALAVRYLDELLRGVPACHLGWSLPIEPALGEMARQPAFREVLGRLAERAA